MWTGQQYSLKYYLKLPEFLKHDKKRILSPIDTKALREPTSYENSLTAKVQELEEKATGLLRFEVTMRHALLKTFFGDKITIGKLTTERLNDIIDSYLSTLNKVKPLMMGIFEISDKLINSYGKTRGGQLYSFYRVYFSDIAADKIILKNTYSRSQIYKNIRDIADIGIGVSEEDTLPLDDAPSRVSEGVEKSLKKHNF